MKSRAKTFWRYMDERRRADSAPAPATLRREVMALSRLMAAAVNRELRSDNPCYRIGAPRPTEPGPKPLEPEQAAILLHLALNIRTKNRLLGPIVATLLYTGARIGEALLLDVPDVRFGEGVTLVPTLKRRIPETSRVDCNTERPHRSLALRCPTQPDRGGHFVPGPNRLHSCPL